ncbi:MAG: shikimate kinase [Chloracidobacterium sp.]|nr:shikimate kinase [Chloracidobacterium sp.]
MAKDTHIALTGFMGVGKSSVARHLANMLKCKKVDLDFVIESSENRKIAEIIDAEGEGKYREIETENLKEVLNASDIKILSLGGGAWTIEQNRKLLQENGFTSVWLEASFDHCWRNIAFSRKDRPLARNKQKALKLFEDRQKVYCLAEWHFVIRPDFTSYDVARMMKEEIFS